MIDGVLTYVSRELQSVFGIVDPTKLSLGSVHAADFPASHPEISISLVNIEEETTLKNKSHYVRVGDQSFLKEPPVHLNLYMLVSFKMSNYEDSLARLSSTIEHFQAKRLHTAAKAEAAGTFPSGVEQLAFDLHTMGFDELNHLWGLLGGKSLPSALYRVRVIPIQKDAQLAGPEITSVDLQASELQ